MTHQSRSINGRVVLRAARKARGLNQSEAAALCHVSFSAFEKWERGAPMMPPILVGCLVMLGLDAATALAHMESCGQGADDESSSIA